MSGALEATGQVDEGAGDVRAARTAQRGATGTRPAAHVPRGVLQRLVPGEGRGVMQLRVHGRHSARKAPAVHRAFGATCPLLPWTGMEVADKVKRAAAK